MGVMLDGIRAGTDPDHEEYWGAVSDYDQRLVEMAVFGLALALVPDRIWGPLSKQERSNLYAWLNQINQHPCYDCNWLFFQVLVNVGFHQAGLPYDAEQMERNLERIDDFYLADGWYSDGPGGHCDYYGPFGIHYYSLLYAKLMGDEDPIRAERYMLRSAAFAKDFIHWHAPDGAAIPYGRSLTYRFAQSAFWSAAAFAGLDAYSPGIMKGLVLRNLRWWLQQPMLDREGILTVGYAYPNQIMSENYNSPGSSYWALKTFLILALPEEHPFWMQPEGELPALERISVQKPAHLVVCRQLETGHAAAFNTGHPTTNEHTHTSAKYEKFVYSSAFAFSVPRAEWGLAQGAYDSMLALSEGDQLFRAKRRAEESWIQDHVLYARWRPWADVEVSTWIVAGLPWHIRIHRLRTARVLDAAEGGFAVGIGDDGCKVTTNGTEASAATVWGTSAVRSLLGYDDAEVIHAQANTNLLHPRTVIPTLRVKLAPGTHWIISAVYGEPAGCDFEDSSVVGYGSPALDELGVSIDENKVEILTVSGKTMELIME
ncbi:hypothetical protein JCM10914_6036 [Paenibacillus sp. JCM 10914]|nr:hypothetical protein JCM10914_6036 [Paenibacillus sp. JCM 10914]